LGVLENLNEITTDTIDLGGRSGDFSVTVHVISPGQFVSVQGSGMADFRGLIRVPVLSVQE
jgi:hypothetical protein